MNSVNVVVADCFYRYIPGTFQVVILEANEFTSVIDRDGYFVKVWIFGVDICLHEVSPFQLKDSAILFSLLKIV